jgi:hypothetical protein
MFSTPSYGEWKKLTEGDYLRVYIDFDRIRKHGGYVYWWLLYDYLEPSKQGHLSNQIYFQGDCNLFRFEALSYSLHKEPMGGGIGDVEKPRPKEKGWRYPPPNSSAEIILKNVCGHRKK